MSKYDLDLDYAIPGIDISREELSAIIAEADKIITGSNENPEKLAIACLKKAQCLQKLDEYEDNIGTQTDEHKDIVGIQGQIKNLIEKALELYPDMPKAIMQMGKIYDKLSVYEEKNKDENREKAIEMYTKAIQLKLNYAAAYNNRGNTYFWKGKYDMAIKDYTEAIKIDPNYVLAYINRGRIYLSYVECDMAIKDYTDVIRLDPTDVSAHLNRGYAYRIKREYDMAIKDYNEAIRLDPTNTCAYIDRGHTYLKKESIT